ncbi:hypothetical protein KWH84_00870 [Enterobacter hormaechei]|uniref:hypothetical protein n=1 Tax=Enterobacter hormaechei TaxID=158836 RepID=UPI0021D3C0F0|nr:hypothetical protein [Enterobacter hormaechei]MCU6154368.1 hypothetical protein [Enterobacter hormaechei]
MNTALSVILQQVSHASKICVVDIESFRSLGAIFRLLKRRKLTDNHRLIFIGGKDITSRILVPLVTINRKSCFLEFRKQLAEGKTFSSEYSLRHITRFRSLNLLTAQEKRTLFTLLDTGDIRAAARKIYLSPKTVYTYTSYIGQKLNLSSALQVRLFIFTEFVLDA